MSNFNFKEEDLLKENKKKKENNLAKQRVEQKWTQIFADKKENPNLVQVENTQSKAIVEKPKLQEVKLTSTTAPKENLSTTNVNEPKLQEGNVNENNNKSQPEKALEKEKSSFEKLQEAVEKIEEKYDFKPQLDTSEKELNLTPKNYINKTKEELEKQAQDNLKYAKQAEKESIEKNFENSLQSLSEKQESKKKNAQEEKQNVANYYANAMENAENDALKRGIQRSSIVINNLNAFENSKIEQLMQIDQELNGEINKIASEIDKLTTEKEKAISDLDIEYAFKLSQEIQSLQKEIDEKNEEITEYNNKIKQIEEEYKNDTAKQQQEQRKDYFDELLYYEQNKDVVNDLKTQELKEVVEDYLDSLSKEDALNALNQDYFKQLLGKNYSHYLLKTQQRQN